MREVIVFDVNETLLDLSAMRPAMEALLSVDALNDWFSTLLRNSMVATMTGVYEDFDELGVAALLAVGQRRRVGISEQSARTFVDGMAKLPAHADVVPALERLKSAGYRLATLTNSSSSFLARQMEYSGLGEFFEKTLSVDAVQRFKPAPEAYRLAAERLDVPIARIRLVAAHEWDVTGAIRAGAKAAFVARRQSKLSRVSEVPDIVTPDLLGVAHILEERASNGSESETAVS